MTRIWILSLVFISLISTVLSTSPDDGCLVDAECDPPYEVCNVEKGFCEHKSIFPVEALEFFGIIVLGVIMALCNAAGIGGGGIVIPICLILFRFDTTHSIALSNVNIFMASLTRFILNFRSKHPLKDAVVVNYEIVLIMLPGTLLGALIGVQINSILPDIVILVLLTFLLFYMGYKSLVSGVKMFKEENKLKSELSIQENIKKNNREV